MQEMQSSEYFSADISGIFFLKVVSTSLWNSSPQGLKNFTKNSFHNKIQSAKIKRIISMNL